MLQKVRRVTVTDSIIDQIISLIQDGQLEAGDKVPSEPELAERLGVGRTSVREALKALQVLGLIERGHDGTFVSQEASLTLLSRIIQSGFLVRHMDMVHLFEARRILEGEMVAMAARHMDHDTAAALKSLCREMEAVPKDEFNRYFELDMEFHQRLAEAAGNPVLARMWRIIRDVLEQAQSDIRDIPEIKPHSNKNHLRLLDACVRHDAASARQIIHNSLNVVETMILNTMGREPNDG